MAQRSGQDSVRVFLILAVEPSFDGIFRTESYDNMDPVGVDPRWDVFGPFHDYLLQAFPLVYVPLRVQVKFLTGLQAFYFAVDQSQHMGFGLRVAWICRDTQTSLIYCSSRYGSQIAP